MMLMAYLVGFLARENFFVNARLTEEDQQNGNNKRMVMMMTMMMMTMMMIGNGKWIDSGEFQTEWRKKKKREVEFQQKRTNNE